MALMKFIRTSESLFLKIFFFAISGVLQEKIMTRQYVDSTGQIGQFKDSQFLVFVNRIMAFAVALLCIMAIKQPRHKAPLYKYSYCSFSNILSSWCQYEALKFISFPTQVYIVLLTIRFTKGHSFCKQCLHNLQFKKKRYSSPNLSKLARTDISCQFLKTRSLCRTVHTTNGL